MGPLRLSFLAVSRYSRNLLQRSMSISSKVHLPCTKFAELLAVILQEIGFEFVLVEEIIPFIHDRLESAATDGIMPKASSTPKTAPDAPIVTAWMRD